MTIPLPRLAQLLAIFLLTGATAGCELIGDIFAFGFWSAVVVMVLVIAIVWWVVRKLGSGRREPPPPGA